jgi:sugar lactone lactonase YvrE
MIPTTTAELVAHAGCSLGESPYWDPRGILWFSDIDSRKLFSINWASRELRSFETLQSVCCIVSTADGQQAVALERSIALGILPEIEPVRHIPLDVNVRFNDGGCDSRGRLFLGTTHREYQDGFGSLLRVDRAGSTEILSGLSISNGLVWSADGHTMVHIDTLRRAFFVYDYSPDEGTVTSPPRIVDLSHIAGLPDGCAMDVKGRVWVAFWSGGQLVCFDLRGNSLERIEVPAAHVTSCCFVGDELDHLAITTANPEQSKRAEDGAVYVSKVHVPGAPLPVMVNL